MNFSQTFEANPRQLAILILNTWQNGLFMADKLGGDSNHCHGMILQVGYMIVGKSPFFRPLYPKRGPFRFSTVFFMELTKSAQPLAGDPSFA